MRNCGAKLVHIVVSGAQVVIGIGVVTIGSDGTFEILTRFLIAMHLQFAHADFVVQHRASRSELQRRLEVRERERVVLG